MGILTLILNFLGGTVAQRVLEYGKARISAQDNTDERAKQIAIKAIDAEIDGRRAAVEVRRAEGAWGPTGIILFGFGAITLAYYSKIVVWDVMLGLGSTDPIRGAVAEWMQTIIISLFGSGTTLSIARIVATRLGR